ncbi:MAG: sporulation protein YqfC [Clostridia bacterium]|nr:sporulation protein YqfC [Clostridia bacterium]
MDIAKKISEMLEIPPEAMLNIPKITMVGKERVLVENYTALLDYKKDNIRLKYEGGVIEILGRNFEIRVIGEENIAVSGEITSVKLF